MAKVTVLALYNDQEQFLGVGGKNVAVGIDAVVFGEEMKPNGYAVPPYRAEDIQTLHVRDENLGHLWLLLTLTEWQEITGNTHDGGGLVDSVFGRLGNVVAVAGDYDFAKIGDTPTTLAGYGITDPVELTTNKATNFSVLNDTKYPTTAATFGAITAAVAGSNPTEACQVATNAPLPFAPDYDNGASGVGATLIGTSNGSLAAFFSPYTPVVGDRVLVQNQVDAAHNGIFVINDVGVDDPGGDPYMLTRATDYDDVTAINAGGVIAVQNYEGPDGTQFNSLWVLASQIITIGVSVFVFTQYSYGLNIVAIKTETLAQFAATTSAELAGVISDETGSASGGLLVFNENPTLDGFTLGDGTNIVGNAGTGNKIGTAANQKWAFFNMTPVVQPNGVDPVAAMVSLGLVASPLAIPATKGGTNQTSYALGDTLIASATNVLTKLSGNITTTKKFLSQTGDGAASASPSWEVLVAGDIPSLSALYGLLNGANTWLKAQRGSFVAFTDAATITMDFDLSNNWRGQLGGNRTLGVPTNIANAEGQSGVINVWQDMTGSRTLAYAWPYVFPDGTTPTVSTGKGTLSQLAYMVNKYALSVVTITIATPGAVSWTAHGLFSGMKLQLSTTGALPTGLAVATSYWVNVVDANTFNLASSAANLAAGTLIATSGSQSGVHTATVISITISKNDIS